jgi:hypothetical protein
MVKRLAANTPSRRQSLFIEYSIGVGQKLLSHSMDTRIGQLFGPQRIKHHQFTIKHLPWQEGILQYFPNTTVWLKRRQMLRAQYERLGACTLPCEQITAFWWLQSPFFMHTSGHQPLNGVQGELGK